MAIESDIAALLAGDTALRALLSGGVYASGTVGRLGITRKTTPDAFDADGYLKPCALVRQRALTPDGAVRDQIEQVLSAAQIVEVWLYQDTGYDAIDDAGIRVFALLEGVAVGAGTLPLELVNVIERERDAGALDGASLARLDFIVHSVLSA